MTPGGRAPRNIDSERWAGLRTGPRAALVHELTDQDLDTLARCAVAGVFDEVLFDELLSAGGRPLEELKYLLLVVPDGAPGRLRLGAQFGGRDGLFWSLWLDTEDGIADFVRPLSGSMAEHHRSRANLLRDAAPDDGSVVEHHERERLRHLLLTEDGAETARAEFAELFRDRDARFDLPGCRDLLDVLDDPVRSPELSEELTGLRERYRLRTRIRAAVSDDFLLTRPELYLNRRSLEASLLQLLDDRRAGPWLVRLRGIGGTGKTTLLRWFSARCCVDLDNPDVALPTLCVRIDGTTARTVGLLSRPWLVLVEAAAQLRRMLDVGDFDAVLSKYSDYRDLIKSDTEIDASRSDEPTTEEVVRDFAAALYHPEHGDCRRLVLLLDNMDDLYLWGDSNRDRLDEFFSLFKLLHSQHGGLRVVVAGRYDFAVPLPHLADHGPKTVVLDSFTRSEAAEALRRRGVTDPETIAAIVERGKALPILIAGFAVLFGPGRTPPTAEAIRSNTEPVIDFLSRRIIMPVVNPVVRWILRYACIPDGFDREFLEQVMLPVLRQNDEGLLCAELDLPSGARRSRGVARPRKEGWDPPAQDDATRLNEVWEEICNHLRELPWFDHSGGKAGTFSVQPDLRRDLRARIMQHHAAALIHERAVRVFQDAGESARLAREAGERERWPHLMQKAIFHAVHIATGSGVDLWRGALHTARGLGRLDWAEYISNAMIIEFCLQPAAPVSSALAPGEFADGVEPRLSGEAAYEARVELARIRAQRAGLLPGGPRPLTSANWSAECAQSLDDTRVARAVVRDSERASREVRRFETYERILDALAVIRRAGEQPTDSVSEIQELLDALPPPDEPAADAVSRDTWLMRAALIRRAYPFKAEQVERAYEHSFEHARRIQSAAAWIAADAVDWHLAADRTESAAAWCERAMRLPDDPYAPDRAALEDLRATRVSLLLDLGRPTEALRAAAEYGRDRALPAAVAVTAAEAHLALCRPLAALGDLDDVSSMTDDEGALEIDLLRARIRAQLLDDEGARAALDHAEAAARTLGPAWRARVAVARASLELDVTGNLLLADYVLSTDFERLPDRAPEQFELDLARAELARRTGDRETFEARLTAAAEAAHGPDGSRADRIRVLCAQLAAGPLLPARRHAEALRRLVDEMERERTGQSWLRLRLFAPLCRCGEVGLDAADSEHIRARLHALLPPPLERPDQLADGVDLDDVGYRLSVLADLYRVAGDRRTAVACQERAAYILAKADPFVSWCRLDAVWRVGAAPMRRQPDLAEFESRYSRSRHPKLVSAMMSEWVATYDPESSSVDAWLMLVTATRLSDGSPAQPSQYQVRLHERLAARMEADEDAVAAARTRAAQISARLGLPRPPAPATAPISAELIEFGETPRGVRVSTPASATAPDDLSLSLASAGNAFVESVREWSSTIGRRPAEALAGRLSEADSGEPAMVNISCKSARFAAQPWELLPVDGRPLGRHRRVRDLVRHTSATSLEQGRANLVRKLMEAHDAWADPADPEAVPDSGASAISDLALVEALRRYCRERALEPDRPGIAEARLTARVLEDLAARARQRKQASPRPLEVYILTPGIGASVEMRDRFRRRSEQARQAYQSIAVPAIGSLWPIVHTHRVQGVEFLELAAAVGRYTQSRIADIVHVCGVVRADREVPTFGMHDGGEPLTAKALSSALRQLTGTTLPLVVLDFTTSGNPADLRRHLLLRNRFAHQLLGLGCVDTLIAAGFEPGRATRQLECLAMEIARRGNAAAVCRAIRAVESHNAGLQWNSEMSDECLPYWATALFSSLPPDALYEPGLFN